MLELSWSGYPPQRLQELSGAARVQKGSWSIAETLWCIKTAQVNSRSGCKGGSSFEDRDLHRGFSLPSSSEGNQQLIQPWTFPKILVNCGAHRLFRPLPLCVSPGTEREQKTEKQTNHFYRVLLRYDLWMRVFMKKKKKKGKLIHTCIQIPCSDPKSGTKQCFLPKLVIFSVKITSQMEGRGALYFIFSRK